MEPLLKINNFQTGIAKSPYVGFADIKNLDVTSEPGIVKLNERANQRTYTPFTAVAITRSGNNITHANLTDINVPFVNQAGNIARAVIFTGADLPDPLVAGTIYWLTYINSTTSRIATTFELANADTPDVTLTDAGSGTMTMASVNMGQIGNIVRSFNGYDTFAIDYNGYFWWSYQCGPWVLITGNTVAYNEGRGLIIWKDYVITPRAEVASPYAIHLDCYGPLANGYATRAWNTIEMGSNNGTETTNKNFMFQSRNGKLYWVQGKYVQSLLETDGDTFDPSDAASYTSNSAALDLAVDCIGTTLSEIDTNILIGTNKGIFTWNKTDDSFTDQLFTNEYVYAMINRGGLVYYIGGNSLALYVTNGISFKKLVELPQSIADMRSSSSTVYCTGIGTNNNKIFWGLSASGTVGDQTGLWSYDIDTGILLYENQFSAARTNDHINGIVYRAYKETIVGVYNATTSKGSIYYIASHSCTDYIGFFISPFYTVGTALESPILTKLEFELDRPFITGEGVRISYRKDLAASWTVLGTYDYATWGSQQIMNVELGVATPTIQFKVEMTTSDAGVGVTKLTGPHLKEIRIWKK